jgi:hypothetical protein
MAKDQEGNYHLLVDGGLVEVGGTHAQAMARAKANRWLFTQGGVKRVSIVDGAIVAPAPRAEVVGPPKVSGPAVLKLSIPELAEELDTGDYDGRLAELLEAESVGRCRTGAAKVLRARRSAARKAEASKNSARRPAQG